jgi:nicotinamidase-related amidase
MTTVAELVDPSTTAIICHEMQRAVVGDLARPGWPTADAVNEAKVIPNLARLLDAARARGIRVVHCAAAFRADHAGSFDNAPILEGRLADADYLIEGTPDVDPVPELWNRDTDVVMHRFHGMTSFAGTELDWLLKSFGAKTVIVTGVSLNRGVTGTVIEAVNYAYRVVIPRDCVVGYPQEYGDAVLEHTLAALAWLTTSDEISACWQG